MPYVYMLFSRSSEQFKLNFNKTLPTLNRVINSPRRRSSAGGLKIARVNQTEREREGRYIHTQPAHVVTLSISCAFLFEQEVERNMLIPWCEFLSW